jgi:hypothetical protein
MKEGYTIVHMIEPNSKVFVLSNYNLYNEIVYFGFEDIKEAVDGNDEFDIGVWKLKTAERK